MSNPIQDGIRMMREIGSQQDAIDAIKGGIMVLVQCGLSNAAIRAITDEAIDFYKDHK
jgi:hypothetical protein